MNASDPVREFLRERGLADEIVAEGTEGFVSRWEQAARDVEHDRYPLGLEDWLNELDGRQVLDEIASRWPVALGGALAARLEEADARVRASTQVAPNCLWGASLAKRMGWTPARQWWYWLTPRAVADDF